MYYLHHKAGKRPPLTLKIVDYLRGIDDHVVHVNFIMALMDQNELLAQRECEIGKGYW